MFVCVCVCVEDVLKDVPMGVEVNNKVVSVNFLS